MAKNSESEITTEEIASKETETPQQEETQEHDERNYASFNARIFSAMIDSFLSLIPFVILGSVASVVVPPTPHTIMMKLDSGQQLTPEEMNLLYQQLLLAFSGSITQLVVMAVVVTAFWVYFAATPGKMILGMEVIDEKTGKKPKIGQSLIRFFGYIISTLPLFLGFFWIHFDKKHQGWHDKLSGTVVVYTEKSIYHRVGAKYARLLSGRKK